MVVAETVRRSPRLRGRAQGRWAPAALRRTISWLARLAAGGVGRLLHRLGVVYRRGQAHLHSPDPAYDAKLAAVAAARAEAAAGPGRVVFVYRDEPDVLRALAGGKVRLLPLPTYAPWTNPIEKVWRWLNQEVLHQHSFGDGWDGLKQALTAWPGRWAGPSPRLLRYAGLDPN